MLESPLAYVVGWLIGTSIGCLIIVAYIYWPERKA